MVFRKSFLLLLFILLCSAHTYAQSGDFCEAVNVIIQDAPNKFRNVRGKITDADIRTGKWECSIQVPGMMASRFVRAMGLFYEGAYYQTKQIDSLKTPYENFKNQLTDCLVPHGYSVTTAGNFYKGLGDYKKLVFMRYTDGDGGKVNGHVSMEVIYTKELGTYSIGMFIYEQ